MPQTNGSLFAVLGVSHVDIEQAIEWVRWTSFLNSKEENINGIVIIMTQSISLMQLNRLARSWRSSKDEPIPYQIRILQEENEVGYPGAASHLFLRSMQIMSGSFPGSPILWMEPDAIPVKPGWLKEIAEEYQECEKPFMGHLEPKCKPPHVSGVCVYPPNWAELAPKLAGCLEAPDIRIWGPGRGQAFDMYAADQTFPQAAGSRTIQQVWRSPRITADTLDRVLPDTCLFHQSKDGALIRALAEKHYPEFQPILGARVEGRHFEGFG